MKNLIITILLTSSLFAFSQSDSVTLDKKIKTALANENYAEAAKLKKTKEIHIAIKVALANEDYAEAAKLKKSLPKDNALVLAAIKEALKNEDYAEAARLKRTLNGNNSEIKKEVIVIPSSNSLSPEFMNQVYLVYNNELTQLERQTGEIKTQTSASPWHAKSTSYYFIKGVTSSIQIDSKSHFMLKLGKGVDPSDMYKLIRIPAHKRKDGRYIPYYTASSASFAGTSSHKVENDNVAITFKKISSDNVYSIYEIIPTASLSQGEYAFMYINKLFAFKI